MALDVERIGSDGAGSVGAAYCCVERVLLTRLDSFEVADYSEWWQTNVAISQKREWNAQECG